jgi:hypothetical protein
MQELVYGRFEQFPTLANSSGYAGQPGLTNGPADPSAHLGIKRAYSRYGRPHMPAKPVEHESISSPPEPDVRLQLEAVLSGQAFRKSERHSHFLRFICEKALAGEASSLNEYLIAHEVFRRGDSYSPSDDSVVRRQAYSLRQKLQDYYANEGKDASIRIELPVGRYVPTFVTVRPEQVPPEHSRPAPEADPPGLQPDHAPPVHTRPVYIRSMYTWIPLLVFIALASFLAGRFTQVRNIRNVARVDSAEAELWGAWLTDPAGAVICFSNPLTAIVKQNDRPFPAQTLPHRIEISDAEAQPLREEFHLPPGGFFYLSPGIGHAKMGEALGSLTLTILFTRAGIPIRSTQSRLLNWEDFRSENLILMGHDEANRWLDPILKKLPLRLAPTEIDAPRRIVNTNPANGERPEYHIDYATAHGQPSDDYGLVSMLNGIDGRHRLLLVNGVNAEGTRTALEFLADPTSVGLLLDELRKAAPGHRGEWHFQAVLHAEVRDKIPTRADLLLLRVL